MKRTTLTCTSHRNKETLCLHLPLMDGDLGKGGRERKKEGRERKKEGREQGRKGEKEEGRREREGGRDSA